MHLIEILSDLLGLRSTPPQRPDDEAVSRRERDLRERLNRLTQEVEVIQRVDTHKPEAGH
jgi:hypothetical protein